MSPEGDRLPDRLQLLLQRDHLSFTADLTDTQMGTKPISMARDIIAVRYEIPHQRLQMDQGLSRLGSEPKRVALLTMSEQSQLHKFNAKGFDASTHY